MALQAFYRGNGLGPRLGSTQDCGPDGNTVPLMAAWPD
jgi:hypothetical protein